MASPLCGQARLADNHYSSSGLGVPDSAAQSGAQSRKQLGKAGRTAAMWHRGHLAESPRRRIKENHPK